MSIEFADPTLLALPADLGGAVRALIPEMLADGPFSLTAGLESGGYSGVLPSLPLSASGRAFDPDDWFEIPASFAALSTGGSSYAYTPVPDSAATGGESGTAAAEGESGTAFAEAGSILLVATPVASETEEEGGDDDGGVTITGTRLPNPEVTDGGNGTADGGGGVGDGGDGSGASESEQNDCRDRAALGAKDEIRNESDRDTDEHASLVYRGADGKVRHSPPLEGDTLGVPLSKMLNWMNENGISMSQVLGFVHNHPAYEYGGDPKSVAINRYPSIGAEGEGDWTAAEYMVNRGAGGPGGANFALYVIDTNGKLREFAYTDREVYENLSEQQRENGLALPEVMVDDGSSCP